MTFPTNIGRVNSLFPHVAKDWWKNAYIETYLYTDGDCVDSRLFMDQMTEGELLFQRLEMWQPM